MFAKSPHLLLTAMLGALCLGGAGPATAQSQTVKLADGWAYDGAVDHVDRVDLQPYRDASPVLTIEKKSPFEADKFLQVYRHFSALGLAGKRIRMKYEIQTQVKDPVAAGADAPRRMIVTRIQCNTDGVSQRSIFATYVAATEDSVKRKWPTGADFAVPARATECTLGFAVARPLELVISNITFEEVKTTPAATPSVEFPLPASTSDLPTLDLAPPAPAK